MGKDTCVMWHKKPHMSVTPRDPRCPSSEHGRSQGINGGVSAFWVMLQDLPWQESSSGTRCVRCSPYCQTAHVCFLCKGVLSLRESNMVFTAAHIQKTMWLLLKWKTPLGLSFVLFFSLPCPPLLCFLSLFISFLCLSLSTLIAICAIIMAHHWEFDWCVSDSNKQGLCRGMLSRWEKIKQIRDHILWLVRTAFVEWILQDAEKSTQHPWEWKWKRSQGERKTNISHETCNVLFIHLFYIPQYVTSVCFLGSSIRTLMKSIQYRGSSHHSVF